MRISSPCWLAETNTGFGLRAVDAVKEDSIGVKFRPGVGVCESLSRGIVKCVRIISSNRRWPESQVPWKNNS